MIKKQFLLILLALVGICQGLWGQINLRKQQCKIEFIGQPDKVELMAVALLNKETKCRTGVEIYDTDIEVPKIILSIGVDETSSEISKLPVVIPELSGLSEEGFYLNTKPDKNRRIFIMAKSPSGLMAGIGKFLRLCNYDDDYIEIPEVTLISSPKMPICGIYFATHFYNFYHVAPLKEVDEIIADIALQGCNSLCVWFDMCHFDSISDPKAEEFLARLNHFGQVAHSFGMKFGIVVIANEGYRTTPKHLKVESIAHARGIEVCPSKPGGMELILKKQKELLESFDEKIDFTWSWPHDPGGCGCKNCMPWGGNGYLKCAEQYLKIYKKKYPDGQCWLSTWLFGKFSDEYEGLFKYMNKCKPMWFDGILTCFGVSGYTENGDLLLNRPMPEQYPLTYFPEISMCGIKPWGGWGANPLPERLIEEFNKWKHHINGGWAYSEGIFEDINKFIWLQFCWDSERNVNDILKEYAGFYFSDNNAEEIVKMIKLIESSGKRTYWAIEKLDNAVESGVIADNIESQIPKWARHSWRWRLLYLRAKADYIVSTDGYLDKNAISKLRPLFEEIDKINYVNPKTPRILRTLKFITEDEKFLKLNQNNLALGKPIKASSVHPELSRRIVQSLVNGIFNWSVVSWRNDPGKDKSPSITIDLEKNEEINLVRIKYKYRHKKYLYTPSDLSIAISNDGNKYKKVSTTTNVPKEGGQDPDPEKFWEYPIKEKARYVKLTFGPSQIQQGKDAGKIGLCQIQITKP